MDILLCNMAALLAASGPWVSFCDDCWGSGFVEAWMYLISLRRGAWGIPPVGMSPNKAYCGVEGDLPSVPIVTVEVAASEGSCSLPLWMPAEVQSSY